MSEVAEKTAEVVADVVEDSIDGVVDVVQVVRTNPVALVAAGVVGLVAGGVGGYFIAKKQLKSFYEDLSAQEIAEAKEFYASVYKTDPEGKALTPQEILSQRHGPEVAAEALRVYQGKQAAEAVLGEDLETALDEQDEAQITRIEERQRHSEPALDPPVAETRNVFDDPGFDLAEEKKYRKIDAPYVITHDEYFGGPAEDLEYDNISLTYYEADDTLTNEKDEPIREVDKMVGDDNLIRFGHGSRDRNIVYIRNDRLETDFEVIKSTGSYVEEVLGMLDSGDGNSLKHSNRSAQQSRRREFRHGE